jgi:hypothetical protein
MKRTGKPTGVGGSTVHIRDCYVRGEIYHLDSPTDYREYLPGKASRAKFGGEDLTMLDSGWHGLSSSALNLIALGCFFSAGLFLYVALDPPK